MATVVFAAVLISACSGSTVDPGANTNTSGYKTVKPASLRAIDNSILSVIVRIDDVGPDFTGEQHSNGSWQVRLDLELDKSHTFIASWFGSLDGRRVLLVEQRGEFFASSTSRVAQATTTPTSVGAARFDFDCDGMSNLFELEAGSDPFSNPGCVTGDVAPAISDGDNGASPTPSRTNPDLVDIPAGCFLMGSAETDRFHKPNQRQHQVCVDAFSMGRYEVTFDQYAAFADSPGTPERVPSDSQWGKGSRPVRDLIWQEAVSYTRWLSEQTGEVYRLPTEAEWEYAARGGTTTPFWTGETLRDDQEHFNSSNPHGGGIATGQPDRDKTRPVGSLQPNPYGLYDILGNLIEFTCSEYSENYADTIANQCGSETAAHVVRGAAYNYLASWAIVYHRTQTVEPDERNGHVGFRVVRENP